MRAGAGTTTSEAERIKELEREVRELKRANEILLAASLVLRAGARPATALVVGVHRRPPGPVRGRADLPRALRARCAIAPSSYYAARTRPPSARAIHDAVVLEQVRRVHADGASAGACTGCARCGGPAAGAGRRAASRARPVPRCQVERLMRADGLRGVPAGGCSARPGRTRPRTGQPDLVGRDFTASRPNELWVVDFTYVPTWSGMAFTAFVSDVFSRRIVGLADRRFDAHRTAAGRPGDGPVDPGPHR